MARVYRDAAAVLVLDGGLQLCRSTEPLATRLMRVLTSGWMRRLWTLQESVLSKELHFAFADTRVLMKDLIPSTADIYIYAHLGDLAAELFRLMKRSSYGSYSIGDVARSLRWRTTSRPSDETLAVASLLGMQPSVLVELSPERRMIRLIQAMGRVPRNVLFLKGGKQQVPGFRWAPTSFMAAHGGSSGLQLSTSESDAVVTPQGLEATYYALLFPKTTFEGGRPWQLKDTKTGRLYAAGDVQPGAGSYTCDMVLTMNSIQPGSATSCVGVRKNGQHVKSNGTFTVYCECQRRLVLNSVASLREDSTEVVVCHVSGELSVCVG
ncbi:uncharacterized protein HRG_02146 [Hirsutella rhossiliensis]|uniref:Uncharacterized protein n=1 Tax=Hirsutella rhossiliensis TaxID=111463 RepID=A0A9P8N4D7_9HYPO|nr:uncharacterized protein HRG_02146 [Hirsutella rhossiliensis]KAH0966737.1 hypothetical protein HRG_02146 [Hirsutella rhossiliensis]